MKTKKNAIAADDVSFFPKLRRMVIIIMAIPSPNTIKDFVSTSWKYWRFKHAHRPKSSSSVDPFGPEQGKVREILKAPSALHRLKELVMTDQR